MACFVYLLSCRGGALYCGWTTDLTARLAQHKAGRGGRYTRSRLPVEMVYHEELPDAPAARRREAAIKQMSRPAKLRLIARVAPASADPPAPPPASP